MTFRLVKVSTVLFIIFLLFILAGGLFLRYIYLNPVLMYHYVLDTELAKKDKRVVTPQSLEQQMSFLKVKRWLLSLIA